MNLFDKLYTAKKSLLHDLDFWTKFFCLLLILPLAVFITPIIGVVIIFLLTVLLIHIANISFVSFWRQIKLYSLSIIFFVLVISLFFSSGTIYSRAIQGIIFAARFTVLICLGTIFSDVTDPIEIPVALIRARLPHKYGITLMAAYRMMPLVSNRASQIVLSQKARGANFSLLKVKPSIYFNQIISIIIPIVLSTLEVSVGFSDTLLSRGYNPNRKITIPPTKYGIFDYIFISISLILLLLSFLISNTTFFVDI